MSDRKIRVVQDGDESAPTAKTVKKVKLDREYDAYELEAAIRAAETAKK